MIQTIDKVRLDTAATLTLETGFTVGWSPASATYLTGKGVEGWNNGAPIRRTKSDRMGAHGSHAERGWRDERLISATGHHVAASRTAAAAYVDDLNAYLGDGTDGVFAVEDPDLGTRWARVYLAPGAVDVNWPGGRDVGFTVHLLAPDPRKYGQRIQSPETSVPVAGQGLTFPLFGSPAPGVLNLGAGGYPGTAVVTNQGTADVGPVFTIHGYVPGLTITHTQSGRRLVFSKTIEVGQTLVLDSNDGTATMDGYSPQDTSLVVAEWVRLGRGETGTFLFESPNSVNAHLTVGLVPAWW